jgi:GTP-binding protein
MAFVDKVQVSLSAGNGGDGVVSFRHEKYVDRGGPDGGDGGRGGDVIFVASRNQNTLANFRYQKKIVAESGQPGSKRRRHGKSGEDLIVAVPVGTMLVNNNATVVADLVQDGDQVVVARGGKGGYGNAHFISSTRQAPTVAEKGEQGEQVDATLELKMIADVGLVGLPNAGKSTLLSSISNARPEIADYPFTTLTPNLGVVDIDQTTSLLFADIPGLIEGAAEGKGLGDEFLRHVERTAVLVHLIDAYQPDVAAAYRIIQKELRAYKIDLSRRPQVVALNKVDGLGSAARAKLIKQLSSVLPKSASLLLISASSKEGLPELLYKVKAKVAARRRQELNRSLKNPVLPVITLTEEAAWQVARGDGGFIVSGKKIERFAARTDFASVAGVARLRDIMKKMGIWHELARQGAKPGNTITIAASGKIEY